MTNDFIYLDSMIQYLKDQNISFDESGFPVLTKEYYATIEPDYIGPWSHKNFYQEKRADTSLCFFMDDTLLYPRLQTIDQDEHIFKDYQSFVSMDISVSPNMPKEVQKNHMLLNSLYSAVIALKCDGKFIPSLRCGDESTLNYLSCYQTPPFVVLGMLGCHRSKNRQIADSILRLKLLLTRPGKVLIYGSPTQEDITAIEDLGFSYRIYDGFHKLYKQNGGHL